MNMKEADIFSRLQRFLDRRTMPTALNGKNDAIRDEVQALVRSIARYAPHDMSEWWGQLEDAVSTVNTTRSWPTEGEFAKAAKMIAKPKVGPTDRGEGVDTFKIVAGRFERGDAVGDEWLYGLRAVEILSRGEVHETTMRKYRSALFFRMKDTWGEDAARRAEDELIRKHEDAEQTYRQAQRAMRDLPPTPDKRHAPDASAFE